MLIIFPVKSDVVNVIINVFSLFIYLFINFNVIWAKTKGEKKTIIAHTGPVVHWMGIVNGLDPLVLYYCY